MIAATLVVKAQSADVRYSTDRQMMSDAFWKIASSATLPDSDFAVWRPSTKMARRTPVRGFQVNELPMKPARRRRGARVL